MLEDPNGSGMLSDDGRHVLHAHSGQNAEEDHFGLVRRERGDPGKGGLGGQVFHSFGFDVADPTGVID